MSPMMLSYFQKQIARMLVYILRKTNYMKKLCFVQGSKSVEACWSKHRDALKINIQIFNSRLLGRRITLNLKSLFHPIKACVY